MQQLSVNNVNTGDCSESIPISIHREDAILSGFIKFVSSRTVRIETLTPLKSFESVKIELMDYAGKQPPAALCQVESVQVSKKDSTWLSTCLLFEDDKAKKFDEELWNQHNINRRHCDRWPFSGSVKISFEDCSQEFNATVRDINELGCCIYVAGKPSMGDQLVFDMSFDEGIFVKVRATKIWHRELNRGIVVGCKFSRSICLPDMSSDQTTKTKTPNLCIHLFRQCLRFFGIRKSPC